jgi:hypothetical protein
MGIRLVPSSGKLQRVHCHEGSLVCIANGESATDKAQELYLNSSGPLWCYSAQVFQQETGEQVRTDILRDVNRLPINPKGGFSTVEKQ